MYDVYQKGDVVIFVDCPTINKRFVGLVGTVIAEGDRKERETVRISLNNQDLRPYKGMSPNFNCSKEHIKLIYRR